MVSRRRVEDRIQPEMRSVRTRIKKKAYLSLHTCNQVDYAVTNTKSLYAVIKQDSHRHSTQSRYTVTKKTQPQYAAAITVLVNPSHRCVDAMHSLKCSQKSHSPLLRWESLSLAGQKPKQQNGIQVIVTSRLPLLSCCSIQSFCYNTAASDEKHTKAQISNLSRSIRMSRVAVQISMSCRPPGLFHCTFVCRYACLFTCLSIGWPVDLWPQQRHGQGRV